MVAHAVQRTAGRESRAMKRRQLLAAAATLPWLPWAGAAAPTESLISRYGRAVKPNPQRVFAAGPPAAVLLAALVPDRLLGWPQNLPPEARAMLAPELARLPSTGRLSGRGSTVSIEALLALQPDLIVDAGSVDEHHRSAAERIARQTGIPYVLVDGRIGQSAQQLRETARLLGASARGDTLAAHADAVLAMAQQQREQPRAAPPRAYLARGADGLETGWAGSINAELLAYAGAHNVATAAGASGVGRVSMEQLLAWNPDVIFTQQAGLAERLRGNAGWRGINAVREGRVWQVPHLPFGWIDGPPGINRLLGLRWLLSVLYAQQPSAAAAEAEARAFYRLFYGTPDAAPLPAGALP